MNKPIIIIGTGGFAKEVAGLLIDMGLAGQWAAFVEQDEVWTERQLLGKPVWKESEVNSQDFRVSIGVSSPVLRAHIVAKLGEGVEYLTLIHPSAILSPWVTLGEGCIISAGCILTSDIQLGKHVQLNLQTTVGHDVQIGDFVTTAPAVNISGACSIGKEVYLGTQAALKQGVTIRAGITVGMGAMVVKDLLEPGTYIGVPARKMG